MSVTRSPKPSMVSDDEERGGWESRLFTVQLLVVGISVPGAVSAVFHRSGGWLASLAGIKHAKVSMLPTIPMGDLFVDTPLHARETALPRLHA